MKKLGLLFVTIIMMMLALSVSAVNETGQSDDSAHTYISAVTIDPTCLTQGTTTYTCTCGNDHTEIIPAKGHSYAEKIQPATQETDGKRYSVCSDCSAIENGKEEAIHKLALYENKH